MNWNQVAWVLVAIAVVLSILSLAVVLSGCTLQGVSDTQVTACAGIVQGQAQSGTITKAQATQYDQWLHATPPTLPLPCVGRV